MTADVPGSRRTMDDRNREENRMNETLARRIAAVERYIHDLAIALAGIPADEREDVIAGVREHIDDSLAAIDDPTPDDVERILASLGDPAEIAADARGRSTSPSVAQASSGAAPSSAPPPSDRRALTAGERPLLTREWIPLGVMGLFVGAAFLAWFTGPGSALGVLFWLGGMVALVASPLWSVGEKVIGALWFGGGPIVAAAAGFVFGWMAPGARDFVGSRLGPPVGPFGRLGLDELGWLAAAGFALIGLVGTVVIMAWLVTTGTRRAQRLTP